MKKGDLVRRVSGFDENIEPQFLYPGVIVRGPYEATVKYTTDFVAMQVVADVLIDSYIYEKIPLEELKRITNVIRDEN